MFEYFKKSFIVGIGFSAGVISMTLFAVTVGNVNTFNSGEPLSSSRLNENFGTIKTAIEGLNSEVETLRTSINTVSTDFNTTKSSLEASDATLNGTVNNLSVQLSTMRNSIIDGKVFYSVPNVTGLSLCKIRECVWVNPNDTAPVCSETIVLPSTSGSLTASTAPAFKIANGWCEPDILVMIEVNFTQNNAKGTVGSWNCSSTNQSAGGGFMHTGYLGCNTLNTWENITGVVSIPSAIKSGPVHFSIHGGNPF